MSEQELAKQIVEYLTACHWEVYQEVSDGPIADIVAVQSNRLWVIECKQSMGFAVIGQALHWMRFANWVSVATPDKRTRNNSIVQMVLARFGLGWLVTDRGWNRGHVIEMMKPQFNRRSIA